MDNKNIDLNSLLVETEAYRPELVSIDLGEETYTPHTALPYDVTVVIRMVPK